MPTEPQIPNNPARKTTAQARDSLGRLAGHFTLLQLSGLIAVKGFELLECERTEANLEASLLLARAAELVQKANDCAMGLRPVRRTARKTKR